MREYTMGKLKEALNKKKNLSIFSPACVRHCFLDGERNLRDIVVKGFNIDEALSEFVFNEGRKQVILIDDVDWPGNYGCANS